MPEMWAFLVWITIVIVAIIRCSAINSNLSKIDYKEHVTYDEYYRDNGE